MILGIDIGGANTKITEIEGENYKIHHIYFPMWKKKDELEDLLKNYNNDVDYVALVMTAELADCYKTKKEGVEDIINKVEKSFDCPIYVFDVNGNFLTSEEAKKNYLDVSASNWMATAKFVSEFIKDSCILVDMGSTTTDIIPIKNKNILSEKTDLDRLMNNQLVYVGTLRTPVTFLTNKIMFRGKLTNLSSEYFAITADISLILNKIAEEDYTCDTPDGAGKDRDSCLTRLARVLCADREMVSDNELIDFVNRLYNKLLELIRENVDAIAKRYNLNDVVITGLGEEILKDALDGYNIISIKETYGKDVSLATPSFAVAKLLQKQLNE
ncbi:H4MPT-linked C1 transfer pathway protein [Methanocaldococcus sp. FS406-22]|uniref:(4-{4-[2-(gamma-L- glutamylamino)ethyl]phenoxymethyl}furan-2-yl)methanamine synthase n=1 Tax=Methanocaldococcus sp. (strain FS406-22) TaxID=644281 RepID=UPI0001BF2A42|nr:(4-{4-[2-(gamma-L-glutamylamino)ethyl]phenoxymethyl}furan-2-yl)methanamine synthase [Methanocaldococcus sp. FS406-22]ADC69998.1 H4MPT-linked C1 transfer pathway protein [Methanocaldococcus sp. FS406-22]